MSHKIVIHKERLCIRITINRVQRYIFLPPYIDLSHWSDEANMPKPSHPNYRSLKKYIDSMTDSLEAIMLEVYRYKLGANGAKAYVEKALIGKSNESTVLHFGNQLIEELLQKKQPGNARWYKIALEQFLNFNNGNDIELSEISYNLMLSFRLHKEKEEVSPNSISNYIRAIRAMYREATKRELFETAFKYPFQQGLIPKLTRTLPRNISADDIQKLEDARFDNPKIQKAVDFWLIGFYLQGSDFIDLANLSLFNFKDNYLVFNRAKTKQPVKVFVSPKIHSIISKYWDGKSTKILPIIDGIITDFEDIEMYQRKVKEQNKYIKQAAQSLGINADMTTKWLRHSWITIAKRLYIDEDIRKQAVGHRDLSSSHSIYADDYKQHIIDAANMLVIGEITRDEYLKRISNENKLLINSIAN